MVTGAAADQMWAVAIQVKVGLHQARGGERDHQFVAVAEMIAARIATAGCPSTACSTAGVVPAKSSLVEKLNEFNLESVKSLILGTRPLLSGQKLPCSPFEGISQEITAAQGFVGFARLLKRVNAEAIPVNFPDSRGEQPTFRAELNSSAAEVLKRASSARPRSPCRRSAGFLAPSARRPPSLVTVRNVAAIALCRASRIRISASLRPARSCA
jgi:hypothetical protein